MSKVNLSKTKDEAKENLKSPDAFVATSSRVLGWIENHFPIVGLIVGVGILGGASYIGYKAFNSAKEKSAAEALYPIESEIKKVEARVREDLAKKVESAAGVANKAKSEPKESARPIDFEKDYSPLVGRMKGELKNHDSTRAALVSGLNLAHLLVQQKRFSEALEVIAIPRFQPDSADLLGAFSRMLKGLVLLENNKTDEAIAAYQEITASPKLKAFHPEALLKQGIAYEAKGDLTKAKDAFERIGREFPKTDASTSAAQYLRLLDLKAKAG